MLINKKTLEHLVELSRIELDKKSEEKLLGDLQKILGHFEELEGVDTENVEPIAGGTELKNVFREDESNVSCQMSNVKIVEAFPEKENGFLKVPPIFQNNE
ncbi:MAG: Asp-tRNA(Asn)/Glu-tRNA(Gln) amidotransferase subunit GatC [bacterium]|nr:Asp-tRNA(Asn)/Glu-tRNA(Gln) amidotransferase subunit GatC [bacterium]